jgi:Zn-finger nucleic acid-binding protein
MRQYERSGVHIDQCTECRGIFLDRGELERLTDAENEWHRASAPTPAPPPPPPYREQPYREEPYRDYDRQHGYGYHKKKRKSFFEELFD